MVHTRLAILGTVDRIPFAEFDLFESAEFVYLPPDEGVIIWVSVRCDERASPVYSCTEVIQVILNKTIVILVSGNSKSIYCCFQFTYDRDRGEVGQPVEGIRKLFNVLARDTHRQHDLELILQTGRFSIELALLRFIDGLF